ncbi:hypothetical protein [Opitutus terrae]|uniref:Uncharacterized protein n=1 Tax=Opitutus terrae (strain DSM 11246 / JCM 15787 / PB90-1) TaxID=452637 RepID=B1ZSJ9_OPITP|nr:hypothetical protein [Opitutus terrae]ACB73856.1 hypothetical protein Oter_0566 [Opitutus terrae PB90-1]
MNSPFIIRRLLIASVLGSTPMLIAPAPAAEPSVAPQPRVRLERVANRLVPDTPATAPATPDASAPAVLMKRMVVRDTPLAAAPRPITDDEPLNFTVLKGGPAFKSQLGTTLIEWGLWPLANTDPAADYRTPRPHMEVQVVRIKW